MKPSKFYTVTIGGSASANLLVTGDYFKIMSASAPVTVRSDFGSLEALIAGQGLEQTPFAYLTLVNTSVSANTVRVFIGDEKFIDGVSGAIDIATNAASRDDWTNTRVTVTNVAQTLAAANANRNFLMLQNQSTAGAIFVNFGAAATVANGIKIPAGQTWESGISCPVGAVSMIGDIASNPDVLIVEGV